MNGLFTSFGGDCNDLSNLGENRIRILNEISNRASGINDKGELYYEFCNISAENIKFEPFRLCLIERKKI